MSLTGCVTRVVVVPADQMETFLKRGQVFTAPDDGVYMTDGRYQRYRKAVADAILREGEKTK